MTTGSNTWQYSTGGATGSPFCELADKTCFQAKGANLLHGRGLPRVVLAAETDFRLLFMCCVMLYFFFERAI